MSAVQARYIYRSESQESNIAAWVRNASREARMSNRTTKADLGDVVDREKYIFAQGQRGQRMDEVSMQNYDRVNDLKLQYAGLPVGDALDKLQRAYDAWKQYRKRQGR